MFNKVELISKTLDKKNFIPEHFPELPLVGRSNVGKSTFLNKILLKKVARVSKTPGRTRSVDFYLIDDGFYIVDLPGFGFAKVGQELKIKWQKAMSSYFSRTSITCVIHLIDSSIPAQKIDLDVSAWIRSIGLTEVLLFTKTDKVKKSRLSHQLKTLEKKFKGNDKSTNNMIFSKNYPDQDIFALQQKFYSVLGLDCQDKDC